MLRCAFETNEWYKKKKRKKIYADRDKTEELRTIKNRIKQTQSNRPVVKGFRTYSLDKYTHNNNIIHIVK